MQKLTVSLDEFTLGWLKCGGNASARLREIARREALADAGRAYAEVETANGLVDADYTEALLRLHSQPDDSTAA